MLFFPSRSQDLLSYKVFAGAWAGLEAYQGGDTYSYQPNQARLEGSFAQYYHIIIIFKRKKIRFKREIVLNFDVFCYNNSQLRPLIFKLRAAWPSSGKRHSRPRRRRPTARRKVPTQRDDRLVWFYVSTTFRNLEEICCIVRCCCCCCFLYCL